MRGVSPPQHRQCDGLPPKLRDADAGAKKRAYVSKRGFFDSPFHGHQTSNFSTTVIDVSSFNELCYGRKRYEQRVFAQAVCRHLDSPISVDLFLFLEPILAKL